jgi:hypothetical protein
MMPLCCITPISLNTKTLVVPSSDSVGEPVVVFENLASGIANITTPFPPEPPLPVPEPTLNHLHHHQY